MLLTLDLPEQIVEHLENKASSLDISVSTFTSQLLETILYNPLDADWQTERNRAETSPGLLALVAEIAALPKESALFEPATKTDENFPTEAATNAVDGEPIPNEEWNRLWAEFEQELKMIERADVLADALQIYRS